MALEPIAIGVKVGVDVLEKVAPKGLSWIATKMFGVSMLAIGERRAGKSSFVNYFEYGLLLPLGTATPRTQEVRNTASFELAIGRDKSLRMRVKKVTDTRGHDTVKEQVSLVVRRKPTVLMIFLDVSRDWTAGDEDFGYLYLRNMLEELNSRCLRARRVADNLKHFCIVLNKVDQISTEDYEAKLKIVKGIIEPFRAPNWGIGASDIAIYRCIAVENDEAVLLLDNMVKSIMGGVLLTGQ